MLGVLFWGMVPPPLAFMLFEVHIKLTQDGNHFIPNRSKPFLLPFLSFFLRLQKYSALQSSRGRACRTKS